MLKIHCFQHVPYEGLGCIAQWCAQQNFEISYTHFYAGDCIPETDAFDWLIVMGGPMGIYDETEYPWLKPEKQAIRKAIDAGKTVVGICLGAQLIASVLGKQVLPNNQKEIGWFDIRLTNDGISNKLFSMFETSFKVFHWHGDTFQIPENAVHLAESDACKNQAFIYGENVLGLQFHFEVTEESLTQMLKFGKSQLTAAPFVQSEEEILQHLHLVQDNNQHMYKILNHLANKTNNL